MIVAGMNDFQNRRALVALRQFLIDDLKSAGAEVIGIPFDATTIVTAAMGRIRALQGKTWEEETNDNVD